MQIKFTVTEKVACQLYTALVGLVLTEQSKPMYITLVGAVTTEGILFPVVQVNKIFLPSLT
jgi:hypothetical protein